MNQPAIIPPGTLKALNAMGYRGPKGEEPEISIINGETVAGLKKEGFSLTAHVDEEFGHAYTVYELTHFPKQNLNSRPNFAGPVAVLEIRTILEQDMPQLPAFEQKLAKAGGALI